MRCGGQNVLTDGVMSEGKGPGARSGRDAQRPDNGAGSRSCPSAYAAGPIGSDQRKKPWASMKSFRPKDGSGSPPGPGRNGERDFRKEKRSNESHASATDPDARLYRKADGRESRLCFMGHVLMENRNGLAVDAALTRATGTAEREAALSIAGYAVSQRVRKRIEGVFGWIKAQAGFAKVKVRGCAKATLRAVPVLCWPSAYRFGTWARLSWGGIPMDEDRFNISVRKFLKHVGVTSQREIERVVREGRVDRSALKVRMTLTAENAPLEHVIEGEIEIGPHEQSSPGESPKSRSSRGRHTPGHRARTEIVVTERARKARWRHGYYSAEAKAARAESRAILRVLRAAADLLIRQPIRQFSPGEIASVLRWVITAEP